MNILLKHAKKETIFILSTVLSGIVTLLYLVSKFGASPSSANMNINDLDSITSVIGSMITIIQIVFYLFIIIAVITAVLSGVYFFKKNKQEYVILGEFIISCINSALLLLSFSGINAICKIVRAAVNGDYSSLLSVDSYSVLSSITSAASNLKYFMYLAIITFIFNIVVLLVAKKIININGFNFTFDETVSDSTVINDETNADFSSPVDSQKLKTTAKSTVIKTKLFFKTKNGKIALGIIAAVIIVFGGYKIYDTFFNYTSIDLASNITISFSGNSGDGYVDDLDYKIDYDKTNSKLADFVDTVYPDYEYGNTLSNGDKIEVVMRYSKETAKANHIKVTNDSKTFTVKGLIENYKKASDLPKKLVSTLETEAQAKIKDTYNDRYSYTYQTTFDSLWFAKDDNDYSDRVIAVYKIDETYTSSFSGEQKTETYYSAVYVNDINSKYLDESKHYWSPRNLYNSDFTKLADPSGIEAALEDSFTDYTFEKIK